MAKDRLICKQCANADMNKMRFTQGGKYIHCDICHAETPLYDAFVVYKEDVSDRVEGLITMAQHMMDNGDYEHAIKKFKSALELAEDCHSAWWGIFVCERAFAAYYGFEDQYGNSGPIVKAKILLNLIQQYANMAIQYADPEIASLYQEAIADDIQYIQGVANGIKEKPKKKGLLSKFF